MRILANSVKAHLKRNAQFASDIPDFKKIWAKLQKIVPGSYVLHSDVIHRAISDPFLLLPPIAAQGKILPVPDKVYKARGQECHKNSLSWYKSNPQDSRVVTGFAYSQYSQYWVEHSWIQHTSFHTGKIEFIETTSLFAKYFGVVLDPAQIKTLAARRNA